MRRLTIVERLMAAALLPLCAVGAVPMVPSFVPVNHAIYAQLIIVVGIAVLTGLTVHRLARAIARPVAEVAATLDAIAYAEIQQAASAPRAATR